MNLSGKMKGTLLVLVLLLTAVQASLRAQVLESKKAANGKYGFYTKDGICVIPPLYDNAYDFYSEEQLVTLIIQESKYNYIDRQNNVLFKEWFDRAELFSHRAAIVRKDKECYVIDYTGRRISPVYTAINRCKSGSKELGFLVRNPANGLYSLVDYAFRPIINGEYEEMQFHLLHGVTVVVVKKEGRYGTLNLKGETVIPLNYHAMEYKNIESNVRYKVGYKRYGKTGVETADMGFLEVSDGTFHGVVDLLGKELVPMKAKNSYKLRYSYEPKAFLQSLKPYVEQMRASNYAPVRERYAEGVEKTIGETNEQMVLQLPAQIRQPEKILYAKEKKGGYYFYYAQSKKRIDNIIYQNLRELRTGYLVKKNNKYGMVDKTGKSLLPCEYEQMEVWSDSSSVGSLFLVVKDGKKGIVDEYGVFCTPVSYDDIYYPIGGYGQALSGGKARLVNDRGRVVGKRAYDYIDNYTKPASPVGYLAGYSSVLDSNGNEVDNIPTQIFNKAYGLPDSETQQKYDLYCLCIRLDDGADGVAGASLCNIGVLYQGMGDEDKALSYYDQAARKGNDQGRKNAKSIRSNRTIQKLQMIGDALTQAAQTMAGQQGSAFQQNVNMSAGGNLYTETGTNVYGGEQTGKGNAGMYNSIYKRWERNAESCYSALTVTGTRARDKEGNRSGSANGTWGSVTYTGMKQNLRKAQSEMRKTREEARRNGVIIQQSKWETATVSY